MMGVNKVSLSIIIPAYNVSSYIRRCLESLMFQHTSFAYEVLLVDDGSTDNTGSIVDEYASKFSILKVFHQPNSGVSCARNVGINRAVGTYISFVDADDWVESNYVETLLLEMQGKDLLFFSHKRYFENGNVVGQYHYDVICDSKHDVERLLFEMKNDRQYEYFGFTWNKCFKAEILKTYDIHFVPKLSLREDEVFTDMYCRYIDSLKIISNSLYNYREMPIGLTYAKKTKFAWMLLCRSMDIATDGISNTDLLRWEKDRIFKIYLNYIVNPSLNEYEEMYSYYHKNIAILKECSARKAKLFNLSLWMSYLLYSIFGKIKH